MATVTNPTRWSLFSHKLGRSLNPGQTVEADEATAAAACGSGVFILNAEPEVEPEAEVAEVPVRKAKSQRGTEVVEEATAEDREKR